MRLNVGTLKALLANLDDSATVCLDVDDSTNEDIQAVSVTEDGRFVSIWNRYDSRINNERVIWV